MRILINSVASSSSGALGILQEYYQRAVDDPRNDYSFLVSTPELVQTSNVAVFRFPWVKRSWLHRLFFDWIAAPTLVRHLHPDKVISLQNLKMHFVRVPQVVYEHNCIPPAFCEYRFRLFDEPVLWVRQNILGRMIQNSLKGADRVIVQTNWMKKRCVEKLGIEPSRIDVEPPKLSLLPEGCYARTEPIEFMYPATQMAFKRHDLVLDAVEILVAKGFGKRFKVAFTLTGDEGARVRSFRERVESRGLPVEFVGWQARPDLYERYTHSVLLFASELESYPLPLIEATAVSSPIIAPDAEYAQEALKGYEEARYFVSGDASSLATAMEALIDAKK